MGNDATALGAYMGVHLTIQLFMLMTQGSFMSSPARMRTWIYCY
jgi:hypothetical protein